VVESKIQVGDVAQIISLPKYWGSADIRGKLCLVIEKLIDSNYSERLVEGKRFVVSERCLRTISD
jgi:hypothetical protein